MDYLLKFMNIVIVWISVQEKSRKFNKCNLASWSLLGFYRLYVTKTDVNVLGAKVLIKEFKVFT